VTSSWARSHARERIESICREPADALTLRCSLLDVVREAVDFDAYVWLLTDPVTCVGAAPLADVPCLPELPGLIRSKYLTAVNRWTTLGGAVSPVALLHRGSGGRVALSVVWRDVLVRYGIGDVASIVFSDQFGCWGFLDLWRTNDRGPFGSADAEFLAAIAPVVTAALRESQARTFVEVSTPHRRDVGPVVMALSDQLRITSRTAASTDWLDKLLPPGPGTASVPASVYNVAAQLLANEAGIDDHAAVTRTHLARGFWLTLRAARLATSDLRRTRGQAPAGIVVTIEETSAAERLELYCLAAGLTPRERELVALLATGADTRAMARLMHLSEHTVQDHLKSIFTKTSTRDRVGLLSRALGTRRASSPPS
jgi:DNA-binding CsgD family transcriptional regulator